MNGSPALRAPTPTFTSARPGGRQHPLQLVVVEAEARGRRACARTHSSLVRAQIEQQHAAARHRDPRRLGDGARRDPARGAAPATASRRRRRRPSSAASRARPSSRSRSTRGAAAPAPWRGRARPRSDRRRSPATPSAPLRSSGSLRRSRDRRPGQRRHQQAERARPRRPAPAGHQLPRVARVGAGVRVEVLLAQPQHFLQPRFVGAHRRVGRRRRELRLQRPRVSERAGARQGGGAVIA